MDGLVLQGQTLRFRYFQSLRCCGQCSNFNANPSVSLGIAYRASNEPDEEQGEND